MATDFIAGCIGGCAGVVVGYPLDTVKVHLQTQVAGTPVYRGMVHCIQTIAVKDGFRGFYRGVTSPLAGLAGINAILFGVYGNVQRCFSDSNSLSSHFLAGCIAGLAQTAVCSPMELAKSRMQVSGTNTGPLQCLKHVYKHEGVRGLFRGFTITNIRDIPWCGIYFFAYNVMAPSKDGAKVSTVRTFFAGGAAGCVSWALLYPVDVIKSRVQVDGMSGSPKYNGSLDCFRKSVAAEGYAFLSRGLSTTLLRAFPASAAAFTVVTWCKQLCAEGFATKQDDDTGY